VPLAGVTIIFPDQASTYTLHTSTGSLQSLSPSWDSAQNYFSANGQVAWGETYWVSRDIDGAQSGSYSSPTDTTADIRGSMAPYVARNLVSHSFQIGEERLGHQFSIEHGDGLRTSLGQDWSNGGGYIPYWDDYGNEQQYDYTYFVGEIDEYQNGSWSLVDDTTGENLGSIYQVFSGIHLVHQNSPNWVQLFLPAGRANHVFRLIQDGEQWNVQGVQFYQTLYTYYNYGTPAEYYHSYDVYYANAPFNPAKGFSIFDTNLNETVGSFPSNTSSLDLTQWYLPKTPLNLRVNASRWFNTLVLVQPNTQETITQKGNLQGSYSYHAGQLTFVSSDFYNPSTTAHPDAPFWLWDATRQEYLVPDSGTSADFLGAYDGTDTDGDLLPDWWERTRGTNWQSNDTDSDGLIDYEEYVQGKDPQKKDNHAAVQLSVVGFAVP
jgi:hypothetical protein